MDVERNPEGNLRVDEERLELIPHVGHKSTLAHLSHRQHIFACLFTHLELRDGVQEVAVLANLIAHPLLSKLDKARPRDP